MAKGEKVVLFTRFNKTLHHVHQCLRKANLNVTSITSNTLAADRAGRIKFWEQSKSHNILLGSTQIMGNGLNLHAASVVIIIELSANPFHDIQAQARFVVFTNSC